MRSDFTGYILEDSAGSGFVFKVFSPEDGSCVYFSDQIAGDYAFFYLSRLLRDDFGGLSEISENWYGNLCDGSSEDSYSSCSVGYRLIADEDGIYFSRMGESGFYAFSCFIGGEF